MGLGGITTLSSSWLFPLFLEVAVLGAPCLSCWLTYASKLVFNFDYAVLFRKLFDEDDPIRPPSLEPLFEFLAYPKDGVGIYC